MSDDELSALERATVHAKGVRGWRRQGFPERSNKHCRDMLDELADAAETGRGSIDHSELLSEIERLEDGPKADGNGAVHTQTLAENLGWTSDPVYRALLELEDDGLVEQHWDIGPSGPRQGYRIAGDDGLDGEGEGKPEADADDGPRARRWV